MAPTTPPTSPGHCEQVSRLQADISDFLKSHDASPEQASAAQRTALLASARALVVALEPPQETNVRMSWGEPTTAAALRLLLEFNVFPHLVGADKNDSPKMTAIELAARCGDKHGLVRRLLKRVANASFVKEVGPDEYVPTALTWHFAQETNAGFFKSNYDSLTPARSSLAKCMKQQDEFLSGRHPHMSPWNHATGVDIPYFAWMFLPEQENEARYFAQAMAFKNTSTQLKWYEIVPMDELLPSALEADKVLMVDVGGNIGGDLFDFHKLHPTLSGRLVVQDLPELIATVDPETLKPVEIMGHDFTEPQTVVGAKAYLLRNILHDWPDSQCQRILEMLKPAMIRDYSKILLNEYVMPEEGASSMTTALDMIMLLKYSSRERRMAEWYRLIESVGLRVVKVWDCGKGPEKLFEVELA